jgi:toxin ParE1/3/4
MSTNSYRVRLTAGAKQDMSSIVGYVARQDSQKAAERLLEKLLATVASLGNSPDRGSFPAELLALGSREYRQVISRPYRLIYKVMGGEVLLFVIADGRRDFQALLSRRLLAQ